MPINTNQLQPIDKMKRPDLTHRPDNLFNAEVHIESLCSYIRWLESEATKPVKAGNKARGTLEELKAYSVSIGLPESDGEAFFLLKEGTGWKGVKDWRAVMRSWKIQGYHPSQKQGFTKPADKPYMPSDAV